MMGISRSGYYKWKKRGKSDRDIQRRELIALVDTVHAEHRSHGYRWTAAYIRQQYGYECSDNFVYKCFRYLGIKAETKHQVHYRKRKIKDTYPNLIFTTWGTVDRPRQVIVSDMTAFKFWIFYFEVTFYFDVFTKEILAYRIAARKGDRYQYINGLEDVKELLKGHTEPVVLHTDQGSVYASKAYNDLIKDSVIVRSMSRAGKPTDNPVVCCSDGDWSGNIFDFYFRIIGKLTADVKKPFKLDEQMMRVDDTSIHAAIREALANALIHADYYGRQGIVIDKDFSKITISNPGTFRISIEDAIAGGVSDTRNARIFNMFSLINVGERSGSGLCDIYSTWEENGFAKPVIQELSDPARVVLTLETISVSDEARNEARNEARTQGLSEREIQMLDIIAIMPTVSAAMLSEQLKISRSTVDRMIKGLKAKEYLRHEGSTKKGTWKILK